MIRRQGWVEMMKSPSYITLSIYGQALVALILRMLGDGVRNGHIELAHSWVSRQAPISKNKLTDTIEELVAHRLLTMTRDHGNAKDGNRPARYAATWEPITHNDGIFPAGFNEGMFRQYTPEVNEKGVLKMAKPARVKSHDTGVQYPTIRDFTPLKSHDTGHLKSHDTGTKSSYAVSPDGCSRFSDAERF